MKFTYRIIQPTVLNFSYLSFINLESYSFVEMVFELFNLYHA